MLKLASKIDSTIKMQSLALKGFCWMHEGGYSKAHTRFKQAAQFAAEHSIEADKLKQVMAECLKLEKEFVHNSQLSGSKSECSKQ